MLNFKGRRGLSRVVLIGCLAMAVWLALVPFVVSSSIAARSTETIAKASSVKINTIGSAGKKATLKTASLTQGVVDPKKTNLMVLGDSLGDGVWTGLYHAFRKNKNIKVLRKSKPATGFVRVDYYDWNARLRQILSQTKIDIAVVMVGANDRQTITTKTGRFRPGSARWREIYAGRVDDFIKKLKDHGSRVYWVGLPITRSKKFTRHMNILNEIFAERARANNIVFVDIWKDFVTAKGGYSANGKDVTGRVRLLRANDGVHFTMRGYRKLAFSAEKYIRADLEMVTGPTRLAQAAKKTNETAPKPSRVAEGKKIVPVKPATKLLVTKEPAIKKRTVRLKTVLNETDSLMMEPSTIADAGLTSQPASSNGVLEKSRIETTEQPNIQKNPEFLAKKMKKPEKNDRGKAIQQALANDFQGILSIVQPDKAVVVASKTKNAPLKQTHLKRKPVLPQRQQKRRLAALSLERSLPVQTPKAKVAPRVSGRVRPVSIESGTPDGKVEYESKNEYAGQEGEGLGTFTGASALASIAAISGLDFATVADAKGVLTTLVYRALLRGDALSPKTGRGDDFSWPRD